MMRQWQRGSPVVQFSRYGPISSHRAVHKEWTCLVLPQLSCTVTLIMLVDSAQETLWLWKSFVVCRRSWAVCGRTGPPPLSRSRTGLNRATNASLGARKGMLNVVTRTIREGIIEGLHRAGGVGGVADYVCRVALEDPKLGVQMMALVVPRQAHVEVTRNEVQLLTVQQLDESLRQAGLPTTSEVFRLDYRGDPVEDATEAEIFAEAATKK